jgi:hypothetical protein
MVKLTFAAVAAVVMLMAPAQAAEMMECDDASMMKVQDGIDAAMKNPAMKEQEDMAMKELGMAKEAKAASKTGDCKMHLESAMKDLMQQ